MGIINVYLSKILSLIDNGKFFIIPMKWIYKLFSILAFVLPLVVLFFIYQLFDSGMLKYAEGWTKFVAVVFCILFFVTMLGVAYANFLFWQSRCKKIDHIVKVGDQVVAIPLYSNLIQNSGEIWGINVAVVGPVLSLLVYLFTVFTGANAMGMGGSDNYFLLIIIGLVTLIIYTIISIIIGFLIVLIFRFIAESIRLVAQIANDARDMGDILRAATMTDKPAPAVAEEAEPEEEA